MNTSREETFGLVTAEAMACGTPVVVYDSTACAELVHSENGFVARSGKKEELLRWIRVAQETGKREPTQYPDKEMAASYVALYRERVDAARVQ